MNTSWWSYDRIADAYSRVAERSCFAQPAHALVDLLGLAPGARFLDAGAGTGVVSALAAKIVGPAGLAVALDPSVGMLQILSKRCDASVVAGALPSLPFPDGVFDAVAAAFVLTHVRDAASAVLAMTRVLRPGGRLAVSSWAQSEARTPPGEAWNAVALEFIGERDLREALDEALPLQERFADPAFLQTTLATAGLVQVQARQIEFAVEMTVRAFAELRGISTSGRFLCAVLPPREWARFNEEATRRLLELYGPNLSFGMRANLVAGIKPAG